MSMLSAKLRYAEGGHLIYWCQGCEEAHGIRIGDGPRPGWSYDDNPEAPTFAPSILSTSGHFMASWTEGKPCYCDEADDDGFKCYHCHTFIRGGMVEFLSDCSHDLAGQTLPLPDLPAYLCEEA